MGPGTYPPPHTHTQSYSNHDIVRLLERIGAEFGACQNAYTSADETVYTLTVPTVRVRVCVCRGRGGEREG